jgi:hypothetical protein
MFFGHGDQEFEVCSNARLSAMKLREDGHPILWLIRCSMKLSLLKRIR